MAKRGRKSKYETNVEPYLKRLPMWRKNGMTEEQIAIKLKVSVSSFEVYKKKFPELMESLKSGKEELIEDLQGALYKKAKGYTYTETKISVKEGVMGIETTTSTVTKHVAADTGAIAFALKNLAKEEWKDNHDRDEVSRLKLALDREKFELEKKLKTNPESSDLTKSLEAIKTLSEFLNNPQPNRSIEDE